MGSNTQKLLKEALRLPQKERAELAAYLIDSLDAGLDPDADTAWEREIGRRAGQIEDGSVTAIPWPEARRMILGAGSGGSNR